VTQDKGKGPKGGRVPPVAQNGGGRLADPGPPYVVLWHPNAEAELDAVRPAKEKVAMLNAAEKLEAVGPRLGHPHSSSVKGETGRGFRELRPRAGRSRWRPIYRRVAPQAFVIFAVAPEAEVDPRGFEAAAGRAVERFASLSAD
jgi:hypothetical protein